MKKINCNITICSHNQSNVCYSNRVDVKGAGAKNDDDTCCASFLNENTYGDLTNNTNSTSQCDALICNVMNCEHNSNSACDLNSITINSNTSVKLYSETSCNDFNPKA